jgi:hypothetical protein
VTVSDGTVECAQLALGTAQVNARDFSTRKSYNNLRLLPGKNLRNVVATPYAT